MSDLLAGLQPVLDPLAWTLLHSIWQLALLGALSWAALALLRPHRSRLRYRVLCAGLALMVAVPLLTFATRGVDRGAPTDDLSRQRVETVQLLPHADAATRNDAITLSPPSLWHRVAEPSLPWLALAWMFGVLMLGARNLWDWRQVQSLRREGVCPVEPRWQRVADRLCEELGIRRLVGVWESHRVDVPTVIGWLEPVVLVPATSMFGLTPAQLEGILAHELAHVKRRDYLVNLLQVVAETLLFYHPATAWVSRQIRIEREHCCDDAAVALCGDRREYLEALVALEGLRPGPHAFAQAADGASLVARVRRLASPGGATQGMRRPRLAAALLSVGLVLLAASVPLLSTPDPAISAVAPVEALGETAATTATTETPDADETASARHDEEIRGRWEARRDGDELYIQITQRREHGRSSFGSTYDVDDFEGLRFTKDAQFQLKREAGTFYFEGDFDDDSRDTEGDGRFHFVPDGGFAKEMTSLGFSDLDTDDQFTMASLDLGPRFVRELRDMGYDEMSLDQVIALGIHGGTAEYIKSFQDLGYELPDLDEVVAMRIHGVRPELARSANELFDERVPLDNLVAFRIHGASPDYIDEMVKLGVRFHDPDELTSARIHGVSPEFLGQLKDLGYGDLDMDELVAMRIHGVSPDFIRDMNDLGYQNIDVDDLVAMRIHGVSAKWAKQMRDEEGEDLSIDDLVSMRILGRHHGRHSRH